MRSVLRVATLGFLLGAPPPCWCAEQSGSGRAFYYRQAPAKKSAVLDCEVAVYGGTPAGVTAAIQAARMGKKTLLISFNRHVGGMTSGGLTATDVGQDTHPLPETE